MARITIAARGVTVVAGPASQTVAIPNAGDGTRARACRITSTGACYVRFVSDDVAQTCTENDALVQPGDGLEVPTRQFSRIAYLQEAPGPKLNIVPLEG